MCPLLLAPSASSLPEELQNSVWGTIKYLLVQFSFIDSSTFVQVWQVVMILEMKHGRGRHLHDIHDLCQEKWKHTFKYSHQRRGHSYMTLMWLYSCWHSWVRKDCLWPLLPHRATVQICCHFHTCTWLNVVSNGPQHNIEQTQTCAK